MKKIIPFLLILLFSCATQNEKLIVPLWYDNPENYISSDKYIILKSYNFTKEEAEADIKLMAENYSGFGELKLQKEYIGNNAVYLLYTIDKNEIARNINLNFEDKVKSINETIITADKSRDIIEKIKLYTKAKIEIDSFYLDLNTIEIIDLNLITKPIYELNELDQLIIKLKDSLSFNVLIYGDINSIVKNNVISELSKLNYKVSNEGYFQIVINLQTEEVTLDNNYFNKYWTIQLEIKDLYESTVYSSTFSGRESQITESSLNQSIARVTSDRIKDDLKIFLTDIKF